MYLNSITSHVLKQASGNPISVWQIVRAKAVPQKTADSKKTVQRIETVINISQSSRPLENPFPMHVANC